MELSLNTGKSRNRVIDHRIAFHNVEAMICQHHVIREKDNILLTHTIEPQNLEHLRSTIFHLGNLLFASPHHNSAVILFSPPPLITDQIHAQLNIRPTRLPTVLSMYKPTVPVPKSVILA